MWRRRRRRRSRTRPLALAVALTAVAAAAPPLPPPLPQIDDGLDLRKAAFECLDILLDAAPGERGRRGARAAHLGLFCTGPPPHLASPRPLPLSQPAHPANPLPHPLSHPHPHPLPHHHPLKGTLDYPAFLKCLHSGLSDHPDVRAPAHHMLARTAAAAPAAVLAQVRARGPPSGWPGHAPSFDPALCRGCSSIPLPPALGSPSAGGTHPPAPLPSTPQLDALIDPLEKTLTARVKSDAVKQEVGGRRGALLPGRPRHGLHSPTSTEQAHAPAISMLTASPLQPHPRPPRSPPKARPPRGVAALLPARRRRARPPARLLLRRPLARVHAPHARRPQPAGEARRGARGARGGRGQGRRERRGGGRGGRRPRRRGGPHGPVVSGRGGGGRRSGAPAHTLICLHQLTRSCP
jgi:hypothetical protein